MSEPTKPLNIASVIEKLPPFPAAVKQLMDALEAEYIKPAVLEKLLMACPVIAGRVLQISNSSFYGQSRKIVSLKEAIVILGSSTLKGLIYTLSVMQNLEVKSKTKPEGFDSHCLWRHSLFCACLTKAIAAYYKEQEESHVFTATLFQHLGLMMLYVMDPQQINTALKEAQQNQRTLFEVLKTGHGVNYLELSVLGLEHWGFPVEVCSRIDAINPSLSTITAESDLIRDIERELDRSKLSAVISDSFNYPLQVNCFAPVIDERCLKSIFPKQEIANICLHKADVMFMELNKVILA